MSQSSQPIRYKSYSYLFKVILNVGLLPVYFGYSNGYFNSINFDDIVDIYQLQDFSRSTAQGLITGCMSFAGCLGALLSSYIINNISRRKCLLLIDTVILINTCFLMIPNVWVLIICRLIQGICVGMLSSVSPLYIREISPRELAGSLGPINQICIVGGVTFSFILAYVLSLTLPVEIYWRIQFGFPLLTASLQMYNLIYRYPYETPKYYLSKEMKKQAEELVKVFYKEEYVAEVIQQISQSINKKKVRPLSKSHSKSNKQFQLRQIKRKSQLSESFISQRVTSQQPTFKNSKLAIIASFHLGILQQMTAAGVTIAYSGQIMLKTLPSLEKIFPVFLNFSGFLGTIGSIAILKCFGRKGALIYGGIAIGIFLFTLGYDFSVFNLNDVQNNSTLSKLLFPAMFLCIRITFSLTLGPVVWLYVTEIVQPNIVPISIFLNWLTVSLVNTLFPIFTSIFGGNPSKIFYFFGLYMLLGTGLNMWMLVESENRSEEEIRQSFDRKLK